MNSTNLLRVMTFNLRVNTPNDGVNSFFNRSHRVLEAIFGEAPDIIGFQEAKDEMRSFLREKLPQYVVLGCGRSGDYSGEGIPIAYRADQFELIEWQTRWLSETPDVPGSRFGADQSKYPRIYVYAKLRRLADGKIIAFVNTHTDHEGQRARVLESDQLLKMMRALQADVIFLTGDLNAKPDSVTYKLIGTHVQLEYKGEYSTGNYETWYK